MVASIAFVGAGPTTLYALSALVRRSPVGCRITVFEEGAVAGPGAPYRPGWNDPAMLSNIASIEIPPLSETLLDWLERQGAAERSAMGVPASGLGERTFVPRLAIGRYFCDQFEALVRRARAGGLDIDVRTECRVVDARNLPQGLELTVSPRDAEVRAEVFDHVVLATGHQWPSRQEVRPGYFLSPWPASALGDIGCVHVGLRGSSLTAIDAAVALAGRHGAFEREAGRLVYAPHPGTEAFRMTMMSRKGLLPEADFYFPVPPAPLSICTVEAIDRLISSRGDDLLDQAFDLFTRELMAADPDYGRAMALETATPEAFGEAYFAQRAACDPFAWAEVNLEEARRNHAEAITVPWREGILRMHEVVARIVPHLDSDEFERFNRSLKPVFVDDYGAVPHESIERMLALHRAGKLEILALGDDYAIDTRRPEGGAVVRCGARTIHYPVFIEATGQRPLGAIQFPFLSLLEQGIVRDDHAGHPEVDREGAPRGIVIDETYRTVSDRMPADRLFCLGLPFLMGRRPFVQGITSSHEMGEVVGEALARAVGATTGGQRTFQSAA